MLIVMVGLCLKDSKQSSTLVHSALLPQERILNKVRYRGSSTNCQSLYRKERDMPSSDL